VTFDPLDPPDPIDVVRRLFVGALVVAGVAAVALISGEVPIRLAEIYREHLRDTPRADALLERLSVKYPASPELRVARRLPA